LSKANLANDGEGLPMPVASDAASLSLAEWREYRRRRARQLESHPDYNVGWQRPTATTADAVWRLLGTAFDPEPKRLCPSSPRDAQLPAEERAERVLVTKQALVVALDVCLHAGRQRRMVTLNDVFDALARRWSDHFRRAREEGRAFQVRDMRVETAL